MKLFGKKGSVQLGQLLPVAILFGVVILATSIVADIVQTVNDGQATASIAKNISGQGLTGIKQLGLWYPTLGMVIIAAVVISVLVGAFAFGGKR